MATEQLVNAPEIADVPAPFLFDDFPDELFVVFSPIGDVHLIWCMSGRHCLVCFERFGDAHASAQIYAVHSKVMPIPSYPVRISFDDAREIAKSKKSVFGLITSMILIRADGTHAFHDVK